MLGKKRDTSGEGVQLSLVITPMLDMAFQLLAFFVMVYNPSPIETHLDGKLLPATKEKKEEPPPPPAPKIGNKDKKEDEPKIDEEPKIDKKMPEDKEPDEKELKTNLRIIIKAVAKAEGAPKPKGKGAKEVPIGIYDGQPKDIYLHLPGVAQREATPVWAFGQKGENDEPIAFDKGGVARILSRLKDIREGPNGAEVTVSIDPDPNLRYEYFIRLYDLCKAAKFKEINFHAPQKVP
jgi:biopolymer transport protein ExbD